MRKDQLKPPNQGVWLTLTQASRKLGVTPNTLRRWADHGQIPSFVTPGGHRRFPLAAIMSFVPSPRPKAAGTGLDRCVIRPHAARLPAESFYRSRARSRRLARESFEGRSRPVPSAGDAAR